jgi:hypothetical protein
MGSLHKTYLLRAPSLVHDFPGQLSTSRINVITPSLADGDNEAGLR